MYTQQGIPPRSFAPPLAAQSQASIPFVPPMRITKTQVLNSQTNYPMFRINVSASASSLSSSSLVTVVRTATGLPLGTVRYHSLDDERIDLTIGGCETKMRRDGFSRERWAVKPIAFPDMKWWWIKAKPGGLNLMDAKDGGQTVAVLTGDTVIVEPIGLSEAAVDEVVLASVAIVEFGRRKGEEDQAAIESLDVIGNIVGAIGGGGA